MKRFLPILALLLATQGCVGPTQRQMGMVLLNISVSVSLFVFFLYLGIDRFLRRSGRAGWRVAVIQLVIWFAVSGLISLHWYTHHARENYWLLSKEPFEEWTGIQIALILYLPFVLPYALIVRQIMKLVRPRFLVDYSLTATMLVHYALSYHLMAKT